MFPLIVLDPPSSLSSHLRQNARVPNVLLMWERSFFAFGNRSGTCGAWKSYIIIRNYVHKFIQELSKSCPLHLIDFIIFPLQSRIYAQAYHQLFCIAVLDNSYLHIMGALSFFNHPSSACRSKCFNGIKFSCVIYCK